MRFIALIAICLAFACSKKSDDASKKPAEKPEPPAEFTGKLDAERIKAFKKVVKPFDKWETAWPLVLSKLGKPTAVDGKNHYWSVVEGDVCWEVEVGKDNEAKYFKDDPNATADIIGAVGHPSNHQKDDPGFAKCADRAAKN